VAVGEEQLELELTQLVQGKMERQQLNQGRKMGSFVSPKIVLSRKEDACTNRLFV
jgi:hypothetical protein